MVPEQKACQSSQIIWEKATALYSVPGFPVRASSSIPADLRRAGLSTLGRFGSLCDMPAATTSTQAINFGKELELLQWLGMLQMKWRVRPPDVARGGLDDPDGELLVL